MNVFFGKFDIDKDLTVISHILLLEKIFIYRCKLDKISSLLDVFKTKLTATYKLELYIARKNDVLSKHYGK